MEDLSVKERIERAMNAIDWAEFVEYTMDLHAADIAEALEAWDLEKIEFFLEKLDAELVAGKSSGPRAAQFEGENPIK